MAPSYYDSPSFHDSATVTEAIAGSLNLGYVDYSNHVAAPTE